MPRLCEQLLGEPLKMPNIATWWCGDPMSLKYVLGHLDHLVIRRAFRRRGDELEFNRELVQLTPDQLKEHGARHRRANSSPRNELCGQRLPSGPPVN